METNLWKQRYDEMVVTCAHTAKERDDARERIELLLQVREHDMAKVESDSIVASCDCNVKTNDPQHHAKGCKYRLICERDDALEALSGRTVSCGQCNEAAKEMSEKSAQVAIWQAQVQEAIRQVEASDTLNRKLMTENRDKDAQIVALREALSRIHACTDSPDIDVSGEYQKGLHCGVEDRDCQDRYDGADYGWSQGVERTIEWAQNEAAFALNAPKTPAVVPLEYVHSLIDGEPAQIVRNAKDGYPEGREDRVLSIDERIAALKLFAADYKRWHKELEELTGRKHP